LLNVHGKEIKCKIIIKGLEFKNPVLTASGTSGYGVELQDYIDISLLGGVVSKGMTLRPESGNDGHRIAEFKGGIINSIGLENIGFEKFRENIAPIYENIDTNLIANVSGSSIADYENICIGLHEVKGVDAIELNISCPNVKSGGLAFGTDPKVVHSLVKACRKRTWKPLFVKLTPNVTDITSVAKSAEDAGADAITCINTFRGTLYDVKKDEFLLGNIIGGVSGPAIKPMALLAVYECAKKVDIPVIGVGGIYSTGDVIEFLKLGASMVQLGTVLFRQPDIAVEIINYLNRNLDTKEK